MKKRVPISLEKYRLKTGPWGSRRADGLNGYFEIPYKKNKKIRLRVLISDGEGWDHVSVSLEQRCPTWEEMSWIKDLFFDPEEVAMQLHPRHSQYVNFQPFTLHIWRPHEQQIPEPPSFMVGPK